MEYINFSAYIEESKDNYSKALPQTCLDIEAWAIVSLA